MSVLNEVINQFAFKGELENCEIFGSGHINTTYLATYNDGDEKCKYIIQKVNTAAKLRKTAAMKTGKPCISSKPKTAINIIVPKTAIAIVHMCL